jgi:hypothetical protein
MRSKADPSRQTIRPLTKDEIDRRIDTVAQRLTMGAEEQVAGDAEKGRPRWISAAELVRRVRPFVGLN